MTTKFEMGDIEVGQVVAEMHGHEVNYGILKGWKVSLDPFEIGVDVFASMTDKLPNPDGPDTANKVIMNKYARAVSFTEDCDGNISSALVIYSYDHRYYMVSLIDPDWDKKLRDL